MFREIYESPWYHPVFFWVAGVVLFIAIARRLAFLYAYLVVFTIEILADATLTSVWSPVPARWSTVVGVVFVILGDLRWFFLVTRARSGKLTLPACLVAFGLAFVVPVLSFVPQLALPTVYSDSRVVFLTYEAMFTALAIGVRVWLSRGAFLLDEDRRWAIRTTYFEIAQYALWAIADLIILRGFDAGYALRLVPNTMYYVFFLPYVAWSMPRALGAR